jgi:hypothetical protein
VPSTTPSCAVAAATHVKRKAAASEMAETQLHPRLIELPIISHHEPAVQDSVDEIRYAFGSGT